MRPYALDRTRSALRDALSLVRFLRQRRSVWISLLVVVLLVATAVLTVVQTAAVSPYIYTLF